MKKSPLKRVAIVSTMAAVCLVVTFSTQAQRFGRLVQSHQPSSGRFYLGLESGAGTASYKFSSNINDLKDLKVVAQGWNGGLFLGDQNFKVKATYGQYNFQKKEGKAINQNIISVKANINVPRLFSQSKLFRVYLVTGVDHSVFSFKGIVIPKYTDPKEVLEEDVDGEVCCCPDPSSGPPPDPGAPIVDDVDSENTATADLIGETVSTKSVTYQKSQINAGLGVEFLLTSNRKYFRMFAESYYGAPLKAIADPNLSQTKTSRQMVINLGVGIGINR